MIEIKRKDKLFRSLYFVTAASSCSKKDFSVVYQRIYVSSNKAICTDGRRIHRVNVSGLEEGVYDIKRRNKLRIHFGVGFIIPKNRLNSIRRF